MSEESPITNHQSPITDPEDEISLLDLAIVLAKHKKLILGLPFAAAILAAFVTLLMPNVYTGTGKILPPQQSQSAAAAMLGQLGSQLGGLGGLPGGGLGIRNPTELYAGMLKSRTIADAIVHRFDLMKVYDEKYQSLTRKALGNRTTIAAGRDGIITIEVDDKDPKRAADLANAYVDELMKLTGVLAVTEASQRRLFFERQLAQARRNLTAAEIAARQNLEKGGLTKLDDQGRAMVEVTARLRGQISVKEVQIGAMRTFAADGNPDLQVAQRELESLRRELARIEGSLPASTNKENETASTGLDNLGRLREMNYLETVYELLSKQVELAKIDEAREGSVVQVVDRAIEPDRKSKPWRTLIVLLSAIIALLIAMLCAFIREALARVDPNRGSRLEILRNNLRWW